MVPEIQQNRTANKKRNILLIALASFILLAFTATAVFAAMTLRNDRVYKGVYIGQIDASGMSRDELEKALNEKYQSVSDKQEITLKSERAEIKAGFPELGVRYNIASTVDKAYAIGRSGNILERLYDIAHAGIHGIDLNIAQTFDEKKVEGFVNDFYNRTLVTVKEGALLITDNSVTIRSGSHGESIDKAKTLEMVKQLISNGKSGIIEPGIINTPPAKFNIDDLYAQINSEPVDASYKVENNKLTLVPHKYGRKIEKAELEAVVAELEKTENAERTLPVTFTAPKITTDMAGAMLFRDELASSHSTFSTATANGRNRGFNMEIAASKINGMILGPGQEFSYNKVVGPRDLAHGFKMAHVYSAGKIIDGAGGGICQVSSTMYVSVLKADLEVLERRNHSFTVNYVPLGQDATAYYGGTDFRFRNSTKWPIKLLASVKGNNVYFSIMGTNDTPGKSVIISSKILKQTPYTIKYIDDPTLPAGVVKEKLPGMNGYVVETYKTIKQDGKVVFQTKLHTSTYKVYAQEMLRGTKPGTGAPAAVKPGTAAPGAGNVSGPGNSKTTTEAADPAEAVVDEAAPAAGDGADTANGGTGEGSPEVPAP